MNIVRKIGEECECNKYKMLYKQNEDVVCFETGKYIIEFNYKDQLCVYKEIEKYYLDNEDYIKHLKKDLTRQLIEFAINKLDPNAVFKICPIESISRDYVGIEHKILSQKIVILDINVNV